MVKLTTLGARLNTLDSRRVKPPPKTAEPFYLSQAWRELIEKIIEKRGKVCEDPECPRPHKPVSRVFGDHVIEIRDGGAKLDEANVMLRCGASHGRKTARARAARAGLTNPHLDEPTP